MKQHFLSLLLLLIPSHFLLAQSTLPEDAQSGLAARAYQLPMPLTGLPQLVPGQSPNVAFITKKVMFVENKPSGTPLDQMTTDYYLELDGWIKMTSEGPVRFRVKANEGARVFLDDSMVLSVGPVGGNFPPIDIEAEGEFEVPLDTEPHPLRIEYFNRGGKSSLQFEWYIEGIRTYAEVPEQVLPLPGTYRA